MFYQYAFIPALVLIPFFILNSKCHTPKNDSDVFVTYEGHAEANDNVPSKVFQTQVGVTENGPAVSETVKPVTDVLFIPTSAERGVERFNVDEIITKKTIGDFFDYRPMNVETEAPPDILFVSGKNNENIEKSSNKQQPEARRRGNVPKKPTVKSLNCTALDCNDIEDSVCGSKMDNRQLKYRLFLNECFYRKVNCGFKHEENRYQIVDLDKCKNTAARYRERPIQLYRMPPKHTNNLNDTRRVASRRSQTMGINGRYCTHECPVSCPDVYDPQCAVSGLGHKKMFSNHCQMDYNSCVYGVVWHMRPLSQCVGGKKADLQQNRAFVHWMQRVGIVDNKGRLVLN